MLYACLGREQFIASESNLVSEAIQSMVQGLVWCALSAALLISVFLASKKAYERLAGLSIDTLNF